MNLIIFHPEAENDLNSTIDFYNRKVSGLGLEFLEEIERVINLIDKKPDRWLVLKYWGRRYVVKQFPYSIFIFLIQIEFMLLLLLIKSKNHFIEKIDYKFP